MIRARLDIGRDREAAAQPRTEELVVMPPFRPFDGQLADGLRSVGSCHSFPLVGRGVPVRTWITDEIARDQAWLATRSLEQPVGQGFFSAVVVCFLGFSFGLGDPVFV